MLQYDYLRYTSLHMPQKYSFFHEILYVNKKKWVDVLTIFILKFIKYDIYVFFIIIASTPISQGNTSEYFGMP
jgi:hypothetical protein